MLFLVTSRTLQSTRGLLLSQALFYYTPLAICSKSVLVTICDFVQCFLLGKNPSSYNIIEAAQYGHLERCRQLVEEEGTNVRAADSEGITPLHWASINNRFAVSR